jgi:O-antigen/teichoic acid export membrane protein
VNEKLRAGRPGQANAGALPAPDAAVLPMPETGRPPRTLSMFASSLGLIAGKVATMGLGFLFWLLAARVFVPADVGLATGALSAVMLCTQIALLGAGSAVIVHFPRHRASPSHLLDAAFTLVVASALLAALLFLALAFGVFHELRVVASDPAFSISFLAISILGTAGLLLDHMSAALRRGDQALTRALLFGIVTIGLLGGVTVATDYRGSFTIFVTWVGGSLAACLLGAVQLRRSLAGYRYRPRIRRYLIRSLLSVGLPNHALTLAERAPALILPIVVVELVSPEANAAWYAAWMMAWLLYFIPVQVGMTIFAEAAHRVGELGELVRHGIRTSLLLGLPAAAALALAANFALSILGPTYADAGTTPLRILVIAVVPLTLIQAYFVVCRSTRRLREATVVGVANGLAGVGGAAFAATTFGLRGIAFAWLLAQFLTAAWAVPRLWWLASASDGIPRAYLAPRPVREVASGVTRPSRT